MRSAAATGRDASEVIRAVPRVAVIGMGNVLAGDDAAGPTAVRTLEAAYELDLDVDVVAEGVSGLDVAERITGVEAAIFVDTLQAPGAPGDVRVLDGETVLRGGGCPTSASLHDSGLREALMLVRWRRAAPPVIRLVGVIPESLGGGIGLTTAVRAAIPVMVGHVVAELRARGVRVPERVPPRPADLWWDRRAGGERVFHS